MLIPPNVLKAAARAASKDATRYQLQGVHIQRTGPGLATATATDGKQLFHARFSDGKMGPDFPDVNGIDPAELEGAAAVIPLAEIPGIVKMATTGPSVKAKPILGFLQVEEKSMNGTIRIGATDLDAKRDVTVKGVDGTYPDFWAAVGPYSDSSRTVTVRVNPEYMANMMKAVMEATPDRNTGPMVELRIPVDVLSGRVEKAIQIRRGEGIPGEIPVEAIGLVMPLITGPIHGGELGELEARAAELESDARTVRDEIRSRLARRAG